MLESLRIAVVGNARVLHRRIDHDLHGDLELAGVATDRDVRAGQGHQVLFGTSRVEESHTEQSLRVDKDLVGGHAANS